MAEEKSVTEQLTEIKSFLSEEAKKDAIAAAKAEVKAANDKAEAAETKAADAKAEVKAYETRIVKLESDAKVTQDAYDKLEVKMKRTPLAPTVETKSLSDVIGEKLNDKDMFGKIQDLAENKQSREKRFDVEIKAVGDMTVSGNYTGQAALNVVSPNLILNPNRKVHVRDLVPKGTVGAGTSLVIPYENGIGEGMIAPVAEGAMKPQIDLDLAEKTVGIETIAGWLRVTRKMLNNVPGFISYLQNRLPQLLLNVEDQQMLTGTGVSPNLKGIMTAGNFTAATTTATVLVERLMDSIAQLWELNREANGIVIDPTSWMSIFKQKASGSGEYDTPNNVVFINNTLFVAGVPIYASTAMSGSGKFIVGDWMNGAQLLTQEAMRVEFFEQDGTNVRENKITVRIEETIAFPVYGINFFIVGNISAT